MVDLSSVKPGDELILKVRVREIASDGTVWCDDPFNRHRFGYGAFTLHPQIIEHRPKALSVTPASPQLAVSEGEARSTGMPSGPVQPSPTGEG